MTEKGRLFQRRLFATSTSVACDSEEPVPPPPSTAYQEVRNAESVRIDARTKLREIEIEIERLEELLADEKFADMVYARPEVLTDLEDNIVAARDLLEGEGAAQSRHFRRFREDAEEDLSGFEKRLAKLKKEKPTSADAGSSNR